MKGSGLRSARVPATLEEARAMVAYNERIVTTSQARERRNKAIAMLRNLRPHLARLEAETVTRRTDRARRTVTIRGTEYEVTFDGS